MQGVTFIRSELWKRKWPSFLLLNPLSHKQCKILTLRTGDLQRNWVDCLLTAFAKVKHHAFFKINKWKIISSFKDFSSETEACQDFYSPDHVSSDCVFLRTSISLTLISVNCCVSFFSAISTVLCSELKENLLIFSYTHPFCTTTAGCVQGLMPHHQARISN